MTGWNFDMSAAPRGHYETRTHERDGKTVSREVFVSVPIILAARDGGIVTTSRWLPDAGRWNMFASGEEPLAWMEWPKHPSAG